MSEAFYALFSKLEGDPNVGVDIATAPPGAPQPVRLDVSPISRVFYFLSQARDTRLTLLTVDCEARHFRWRSHALGRRPIPVHL